MRRRKKVVMLAGAAAVLVSIVSVGYWQGVERDNELSERAVLYRLRRGPFDDDVDASKHITMHVYGASARDESSGTLVVLSNCVIDPP
jgi:hypothetical protein